MDKIRKLLGGKRKKFNLCVESSASSDFDDFHRVVPAPPSPPVVHQIKQYHISLSIREKDGSLVINHTATSDNGGDDSDYNNGEVRKVQRKQQRSNSQRSNKSRTTTVIRQSNRLNDSTSDDEAFMNNEDNFLKSPRPLRRSLRKKKTSSLKRRPGIQTVPEIRTPTARTPAPVTSLDETIEETGDLSLQWIENYAFTEPELGSSENMGPACHIYSERSLIIANAETEDALSDDYTDYGEKSAVFKVPYPVRRNDSKRKLILESDEEFIVKSFRAPVKRNCIRYLL